MKHGLDSNVCGQTELLLSKRFQNTANPFPEHGISRFDISFFASDTAGSENKPATREERESFNKRKRPLQRLSSDKVQSIMCINIRESHLKLQNFSWIKSPEIRRTKADKLRFNTEKSI